MTNHQKNIETYLHSGGDSKTAARLAIPNLQNRAKLAYLISQFSKKPEITSEKISEPARQPADNSAPEPEKPKFLGLISQYPGELHPAYSEAYSSWLELCSLKLQLNVISPENEKAAYQIQTAMLRKISRFEKCKKALDYYNKHKAIMPIDSKKDFSGMADLELDRERRNLASNICKRKQTIVKKESELPDPNSPLYQRRLEALHRKIEELEELILDEEKILELIDRK